MKYQSLGALRQLPIFLIFLLLFTTACKKNGKRAKKISSDVFSYVYAYTSGTISKSAPIKVRFTKAVVESDQVGNTVDNNLFSVAPDVSGNAIWENDHTLVFVADDNFASGQYYVAKVTLDKLFDDVPAGAKVFEFDFKIKDIFFEVSIDGLVAEDPSDLTQQLVAGNVFVSDEVDANGVEQLLTAKQNNKTLPIRWEHSGQNHRFFV